MTNVKVNINTEKILRKHHCKDAEAAKYLGNLIRRNSDKRVPMSSGTLKNNAQIKTSGTNSVQLVYSQPYAHYQYEGKAMGGRAPKHYTGKALTYNHAPTRGSDWINRTWQESSSAILSDFANYVGGRKG